MKKLTKGLCLLLCLVFLMTLVISCNSASDENDAAPGTTAKDSSNETTETAGEDQENESDSESETETQEEIKETSTEIKKSVISFADYSRSSSRTYLDLKKDKEIAVSFTVPDGEIKEMYLNLSDINGFVDCCFDVNLYPFNGRYESAVASEPIYSEQITSTMRTYTIAFEDGLVTKGDYLLVVSYAGPDEIAEDDELHYKVVVDNCWQPKTYPEEFKQYSLKSYTKGKLNKKTSICGGFLIEHAVEVAEEDVVSPDNTENIFSDGSAKVILLGGQSNATGSSLSSLLMNNVSDEEYQEYLNGYPNVKILYTSGSTSGGIHYRNVVDTFQDTKLGQGYTQASFGPEVGLAAFLNETYPDETFYIIKYAIGGSGLYAHWNPTDSERNQCLTEFMEKVDLGLSLIEDLGYDPQIVAFLWMQGEADASTVYRANEYYELQKQLVEQIRDEYAFYAPTNGIAFIDATISNSGMWASWYLLNDIKLRYSLESDMNFCIDTNANGLTTLYENNDPAHYDSTSMILLGRLFGQELTNVLE